MCGSDLACGSQRHRGGCVRVGLRVRDPLLGRDPGSLGALAALSLHLFPHDLGLLGRLLSPLLLSLCCFRCLKLVEAGNAVCAHAATVLAAASAVTAVGVGHARCEALDENAEHREHEEVARRGEHCVVM